jgi:predicted RNase H-like nuclease (RuvC/YqgF family)
MKQNEQNIWAVAVVALISGVGIGFLIDQEKVSQNLIVSENHYLEKKVKGLQRINQDWQDEDSEYRKKYRTLRDKFNEIETEYASLTNAKNEYDVVRKELARQQKRAEELSKKYAEAMTQLYMFHVSEMALDQEIWKQPNQRELKAMSEEEKKFSQKLDKDKK